MSAYEVDTTHIDALLTAGLWGPFSRLDGPIRWMDTDEDPPQEAYDRGSWEGRGTRSWYQAHVRQLSRETADRVGAILIAENRRSVNHRYDEEELEQFYTYRALPGYPDPLVILRAIACYEYQSCEHPQWPKSEAKRFVDALRGRMITQLTRDVDIDEIRDRDAFVKYSYAKAVKEGRTTA